MLERKEHIGVKRKRENDCIHMVIYIEYINGNRHSGRRKEYI